MQAGIDKAEATADTIFTLQKRDDGWNDVRDAIEKAKEERSGALDQLKSNFESDATKIRSSAAVRWTKVRTLPRLPPCAQHLFHGVTGNANHHPAAQVIAEELIDVAVGGKADGAKAADVKPIDAFKGVVTAVPKLAAAPTKEVEEESREYANEKQRQVTPRSSRRAFLATRYRLLPSRGCCRRVLL